MSATSEKAAQAERRKEKQKIQDDDAEEMGGEGQATLRASDRTRAMQDSYYRLKHIHISKKQTIPLLLQNENGPCPLLAICTASLAFYFYLLRNYILMLFQLTMTIFPSYYINR
jgi:hypothetical protein